MSPPRKLFQSQRLPARAAYSTLLDDRGKPRQVNIPPVLNIRWISAIDALIVNWHWQCIRHADSEDTWAAVYTSGELACELRLPRSGVKQALRRLESCGLLIRERDTRVLFICRLTAAHYVLRRPLPDPIRAAITSALRREDAFRPVYRVTRRHDFHFGGDSDALILKLPDFQREILALAQADIAGGSAPLKDGEEMSITGSQMNRGRATDEPEQVIDEPRRVTNDPAIFVKYEC